MNLVKYLFGHLIYKGIKAHNLGLAGITASYAYGAFVGFLLTDYQHVRTAVNLLGFTYLISDLLISVIKLDTDTVILYSICNLGSIVISLLTYRQYLDLKGSQPYRELTLGLFYDVGHETVK